MDRQAGPRYHADLFPARITGSSYDGTSGEWRHSWQEQWLTAADVYGDAVGGRSGSTTVAYAVELNNALIPPDTVVWLRLRGQVEGVVVYECLGPMDAVAPAQAGPITTDLDDYSLPGPTAVLEVTADVDLTGLVPLTGVVVLINSGTATLTVKNESASSSADNRIVTVTGGDLAIRPGMALALIYDAALGRYRVTCCSATGYDYTPADVTISSSQNNYAIANPSPVQLWDVTGDYSVTGIVPPTYGPGVLTITNTGSGLLTLANESGSSTAANRISTPTGAPLVVRPGATATLRYDPALERWVPVGGSAVTAPQTLYLPEQSAPATPPSGWGAIWQGTDGHVYGLDDAGTSTDLTAGAGGGWVKVQKSYTDFSAGSPSNTITLLALGANDVLEGLIAKPSTAFGGGGILSYNLSGGVTGSTGYFFTNLNGTVVSNTNFAGPAGDALVLVNNVPNKQTFAGDTVTLTANAGASNLNVATAGVLDVWYRVSTLP